MLHSPARRLPLGALAILLPSLLVGACSSREQQSASLLDQRLRTRMASDIAAHRASLEQVPYGDRVTLLDNSAYPATTDALDDRESDPRASVIEALLDPELMQVQVADTSALPDDQRATRVRNVVDYFASNGIGAAPLYADAGTPIGSPAPVVGGLAITINVACPHRNDGSGYDSGQRKPGCF